MLSTFRNMLNGVGAWIVGGLLVLAFAFFGVPRLDNFRAQSALKVGDRSFSAQAVDAAFQRRLSRAQAEAQAQGQTVPSRQDAIGAGLLDSTLQEMTTAALITEEADRLGLTATDAMVQRAVRESGAFNDPETGEFSAQRLALALNQSGIAPSEFRDDVREDIIRSQIAGAISAAASAPDGMTGYLLLRQAEERTVRTAVITAEAPAEADEAALRAYYDAHTASYQRPEYRRYRALLIDEASIADQIEVSDEDVRALYEARREGLASPETRTFRQARFRDEATAETAAERIRGGEAFDTVAAELGVTVSPAETRRRGEVVDEAVRDAVFTADAPGLVGPIDGVFGTVLADLQAIEAGSTTSFEDSEAELRQELRDEDSRRAFIQAVEDVESAFDEGATLEEAASAAGLAAPRTYGPVDADLFTPEGAIEDAPGAVQRTAFTIEEGELSEAIDLDEGGYAFVTVDEVQPEATRPFEEVREEVAADQREEAARTALRTAVEAFQARVAGGEAFEDAAQAIGSDVQTRSFSVARPDPSLPPAFLRALFLADLGTVVAEPTATGDSAVVAVVDEVRFGADPTGGALRDAAREQLGQSLTEELIEAYLEALRDEFGVRRNDAALAVQFGDG
ncbi:peptidylprolyl isomerase [Parvularcula dongshanensis]|uniref:Peptidyl-prolyl cis-trans isomerase D n=1 Tax=Parvularcula dongshanensis TaxID=1173995 RepID=A0A840I6C5_9PROT|nr:peptidylprolyl isomerase [Parvularcula dongshanensis]MBB4659803.1 peptidyl-prolyl cis-trans isomerase D [Parvularcula dongshanensis]